MPGGAGARTLDFSTPLPPSLQRTILFSARYVVGVAVKNRFEWSSLQRIDSKGVTGVSPGAFSFQLFALVPAISPRPALGVNELWNHCAPKEGNYLQTGRRKVAGAWGWLGLARFCSHRRLLGLCPVCPPTNRISKDANHLGSMSGLTC